MDQKWKRLSLILLLILVIFLVGGSIAFIAIKKGAPPLPETMGGIRPVTDQPQTGGPEIQIPDSEQLSMQRKADLVKILPVITSQFSLVYNENDFTISVKLKKPYDQSQAAFYLWLKENQYDAISAQVFKLSQQ